MLAKVVGLVKGGTEDAGSKFLTGFNLLHFGLELRARGFHLRQGQRFLRVVDDARDLGFVGLIVAIHLERDHRGQHIDGFPDGAG